MKAAKQKRLSTQMYGYSGDSKPIFVDEQLTKYTYSLFVQAKQLKKHGIKHVWVSNGDVLSIEADDSQTKRIHSSTHVKEIEKALSLSKKKAVNNKSHQRTKPAGQRIKAGKAKSNDKRNQTQRSDDDDEYESS